MVRKLRCERWRQWWWWWGWSWWIMMVAGQTDDGNNQWFGQNNFVVLCRILKRSRNNIFGSFDTNTFRSNYANVGRKKDQNISIKALSKRKNTLIMMMMMRACNNLLGQAVRMSVTRLMEWLCRACLLRNWRSRDLTWAPDHFTASLRLLRRCLHQLASSSQRIHLLLRLLHQ